MGFPALVVLFSFVNHMASPPSTTAATTRGGGLQPSSPQPGVPRTRTLPLHYPGSRTPSPSPPSPPPPSTSPPPPSPPPPSPAPPPSSTPVRAFAPRPAVDLGRSRLTAGGGGGGGGTATGRPAVLRAGVPNSSAKGSSSVAAVTAAPKCAERKGLEHDGACLCVTLWGGADCTVRQPSSPCPPSAHCAHGCQNHVLACEIP